MFAKVVSGGGATIPKRDKVAKIGLDGVLSLSLIMSMLNFNLIRVSYMSEF